LNGRTPTKKTVFNGFRMLFPGVPGLPLGVVQETAYEKKKTNLCSKISKTVFNVPEGGFP